MTNEKTLSQRANEVVKGFAVMVDQVNAAKADVLNDTTFKARKEYKELQAAKTAACAAVESYEMAAVKDWKKYNALALLVCTQAVRAYGRKYNVPTMCDETFLKSDTFAKMVAAHPQYFDTPARVASFVVKVHAALQTKAIKVTARIPFTFAEIRQFVQIVAWGAMSKEEARAKVRAGKQK